MKIHDFSLKIHEKSWILTISQSVLGNLGVEGDHPPKMCAGLGGGIEAHAHRLALEEGVVALELPDRLAVVLRLESTTRFTA